MNSGLGAILRAARGAAHAIWLQTSYGLQGPVNAALSSSIQLWAQARIFCAHTGLTRMVSIITDPDTKRMAARCAAGMPA